MQLFVIVAVALTVVAFAAIGWRAIRSLEMIESRTVHPSRTPLHRSIAVRTITIPNVAAAVPLHLAEAGPSAQPSVA